MAWRTVLLQNAMKLKLEHGQLKCSRDDGSVTIPVEDITVLIMDSLQITLTAGLLNALQKHGVAVIVCGENHHPGGLFLPYHQHTRISEVAPLQVGWSRPFRKRCWQVLIKTKISNQAGCLKAAEKEGFQRLEALAGTVDSGDGRNVEGAASRFYWPRLMGDGFQRKTYRSKSVDLVNSALNYGYAIIRATLARAVVAHGLLACFGLHHDSNLNSFNLVDDLIEPYRPFVDFFVTEMADDLNRAEEKSLDKEHRARLASLTSLQVSISGEMHTLTNAAEMTAESLIRAIKSKDAGKLVLPVFTEKPS